MPKKKFTQIRSIDCVTRPKILCERISCILFAFFLRLFSREWEWTGLGCTAIPSRSVMRAVQAPRCSSVHKNRINISRAR